MSDASKDLEKSLRGDLDQARSQQRRPARASSASATSFERQAYPGARRRTCCPDWRVGIVAMGRLPSGYARRGPRRGRAGRGEHRLGLGDRRSAAARTARRRAEGHEARGALDRDDDAARAVRPAHRPPARQRRRARRARCGSELFSSSRGEYRGPRRDRAACATATGSRATRRPRRTASSPALHRRAARHRRRGRRRREDGHRPVAGAGS